LPLEDWIRRERELKEEINRYYISLVGAYSRWGYYFRDKEPERSRRYLEIVEVLKREREEKVKRWLAKLERIRKRSGLLRFCKEELKELEELFGKIYADFPEKETFLLRLDEFISRVRELIEILSVRLFSYALRLSSDIITIKGLKAEKETKVRETPIRIELFFDDFISSIEDEIDFEDRFREELTKLMKDLVDKYKTHIARALYWEKFSISESIDFGIEDKVEVEIGKREEEIIERKKSRDDYTLAVFLDEERLWYVSDRYEHSIE